MPGVLQISLGCNKNRITTDNKPHVRERSYNGAAGSGARGLSTQEGSS